MQLSVDWYFFFFYFKVIKFAFFKSFVEIIEAILIVIFRHINEDKRKIEGKVAMFDIVYDIDNCPVSDVYSVVLSTR